MGTNLPGRRVVDVESADLHLDLAVLAPHVYVGLSEHCEKVARSSLLEQVTAHREIRVHIGFEDRKVAKLLELTGDISIKREATYDEDVEEAGGLLGSVADEVGVHRSVLGADGNCGAPWLIPFGIR